MTINLDHQLREIMTHDTQAFPISFFRDELAALPNRAGPLHWHPEFEIASAQSGVLEYQVGRERVILNPSDSIFVNSNILHSICQLSGDEPDPMPNIVFYGSMVAPEVSAIYQKYLKPISACSELRYVVFRKGGAHGEINDIVQRIFQNMQAQGPCWEMAVQRDLSSIFEYLFLQLSELPKTEVTPVQLVTQLRVQKMLYYIYAHYAENVTLSDIADAASISRSEAGRCFKAYMDCSPVDALIRHRLQKAHEMLNDASLTLQEISSSCGFHSVNYFSRRFRRHFGYAPSQGRNQ